MDTYLDAKGSLRLGDTLIPKDPTLHAYQVVLAQVAAGEAAIVAATEDLAAVKAAVWPG